MLKTSGSIESITRPGKSGVGVGGDGGGDSDGDGGDDCGHDNEYSPRCLEQAEQQTHQLAQTSLRLIMMGLMKVVVVSSDFDRNSSDAPKSMCLLAPLTSMLKTSSSTDSSTSATQIAVKYDEVDGGGGKLVKKLSKS